MRYIHTLLFFFVAICSCAQFVEVSTDVGIDHLPNTTAHMGGGCAWFDYDNDGWEDLYITGGLEMDKLYRNNGDGTFSDVTTGSGLEFTSLANTMGVSTGDVDNDGDQDIFVITWRLTTGPQLVASMLFINQGGGLFFEVAEDVGITEAGYSVSGTMIDINHDGWLDLYSGNYVATPDFVLEDGVIVGFAHECYEDWLYINNQDGTFTESAEEIGAFNEGCTLAMAATDYNRDQKTDLMVINDFGQWVIPNALFENDITGTSVTDVGTETGAGIGIYGMGVAVGDYDEDLDLDYYITNLGRNVLLRQDEVFVDVTEEAGVENDQTDNEYHTGWGTFFFDFDNDTFLDLYVANGHIPTLDLLANHVHDSNKLYRNNGDGTFDDVTVELGMNDTLISRGCAYADYDKDGDLDVAVANIPNNVAVTPNQRFKLFRNDSPPAHWVAIELVGVDANPDAIGAQVELYAGGRIFLREVSSAGASHASQNSRINHFGLGNIDSVDSCLVYWPDGEVQLAYVQIDSFNTIFEGEVAVDIGDIRSEFSIAFKRNDGLLEIRGPINKIENPVLYDMSGRHVKTDIVSVSNQILLIRIPESAARGIYMLSALNADHPIFHRFFLD